jgi:hypothetical protein
MQLVSPLDAVDSDRLDAQRTWVGGHLADDSRKSFADVATKLAVIQTVLDNGWATAEQTWNLQALGVVFGDILAELLEIPWVMVEDEYGRDPALLLRAGPVLAFPLTMISRRVESGERVDVTDLLVRTAQTV